MRGFFTSERKRDAFAEEPRKLPSGDGSSVRDTRYTREYMDKDGLCTRYYLCARACDWNAGISWSIDEIKTTQDKGVTVNSMTSKLRYDDTSAMDVISLLAAYEARMEKEGYKPLPDQPGNYEELARDLDLVVNKEGDGVRVIKIDPDHAPTGNVFLKTDDLTEIFHEQTDDNKPQVSCAADIQAILFAHCDEAVKKTQITRELDVALRNCAEDSYINLGKVSKERRQGPAWDYVVSLWRIEEFVSALKDGSRIYNEVMNGDSDIADPQNLLRISNARSKMHHAAVNIGIDGFPVDVKQLDEVMVRDQGVLDIKTPLQSRHWGPHIVGVTDRKPFAPKL